MTLVVERMLPGHWDEVRAVYLEGLATGDATFETEAPAWERWDASHLRCCRLVALEGGRVEGWAALSPVSARGAYAGVAEVSVYVAAEFRGRGLGGTLLSSLVAESEAAGLGLYRRASSRRTSRASRFTARAASERWADASASRAGAGAGATRFCSKDEAGRWGLIEGWQRGTRRWNCSSRRSQTARACGF